MSTGIFGIGISGMQAAQLGLLTTEHNVANANTAGYNRQRIVQATNIPLMTGAGAVGQGTHVQTIQRMYDQFLVGQVNTSQTSLSELDSYYTQIKQIDNMLADPNAGLSPALQDFFKGVQQVAANPSNIPSRQAMVSAASSLVTRFHGIENRLSQLAEGLNGQITSTVGAINSYAEQIANLNQRIVVAQAAANQPANDLLDQRDQLVGELNKLIKVSTVTESDGSYNVSIGTGQQLVVGTRATTMTATASNADPSRIVVGLETAGGPQELPEYLITGGQLGGLVRFRKESLDPAFNQIGQVAASMALTFNAQNALGQDLLGQSAGAAGFVADFFDMTHMQPMAVKNATNTGNGAMQATFVSPPPISGRYTLTDVGGAYTLTRQSDGQVWPVPPAAPAATLAALQTAVPGSEGVDVTKATISPPATTAGITSSTIPSNFYTNLTVSDYKVQFGAGNTYTVTRLSDNKSVASGTGPLPTSVTFDGIKLDVSAYGASGDSFLIQPGENAARNIALNSSVAADPRLIAAGMPVTTQPSTANVGTMNFSQGTVSTGYSMAGLPLTIKAVPGPLPGTIQLSGFPAGIDVTAIYADGSTVASTGTVDVLNGTAKLVGFSFNGMKFDVTGSPVVNDSFSIQPNARGVDDGRNVLLLSKLQMQKTTGGASASYQDAYAQLVSSIGNKTRETEVTSEAQQALLDQATNTREAMSGVNLDEEAANLLRYQQAYQAAAKMLDIGNKLFDSVLSIAS